MRKLLAVVLALTMIAGIFSIMNYSPVFAEGLSGAVFTTDENGDEVNQNLYENKNDVYLNGGPRQVWAAGLPDGLYYIQVTDPSGGMTLGRSIDTIAVENGEFVDGPYKLAAILQQYQNNKAITDENGNPVMGFSDSPHGVYKVWASQSVYFVPSGSKTDNFKIRVQEDNYTASISGYKFEDANFDGVNQDEPMIPGWEISLYKDSKTESNLIDIQLTDENGHFLFNNLPAGTYIVAEASREGWVKTYPKEIEFYTITLAQGQAVSDCIFGNTQNGQLIVKKFYDADGNGKFDEATNDTWLDDWKINISIIGDEVTTYRDYIKAGTYTVDEYMPIETGWYASKGGPVLIAVELAKTTEVEFGNVAVGKGGGLTLGFWSNKNGMAVFNGNPENLQAMKDLNLKTVSKAGQVGDFDPKDYSAFRAWILSAYATNMDYMLSAQLAAMKLNVLNGKVDPNAYLWDNENSIGIKVSELLTQANAALAAGSTETREEKEHLKNLLDMGNNNINFILPTPPAHTFSSAQ